MGVTGPCLHVGCGWWVFQDGTPLATSALVEVGDGEVVRPITSDNATPQRPFSISNAGPRKWMDQNDTCLI